MDFLGAWFNGEAVEAGNREEASRETIAPSNNGSDFIVMGSGTSSGTPRLACLTHPEKQKKCACARSIIGDRSENKDFRLNPSILFRLRNDNETRYILVDACKTFRQAAITWFPKYGVPHVDALLLTHEHSDAMLGMDDLREAQKSKTTLPVYMSERCYQRVHDTFGYLMTSEPEYLDGVQKTIPAMKKATASKSFTAALKCTVVASPDLSEAKKPRKFSIQGMAVEAFPVYHGKKNLTLGFVFGSGTSKFVYISDMHELPKDSETYLKSLNIELLMVDAIHPHKPWGDSHQSVEQAIKFGLRMGATELLLTGLGHKVLHKETSDDLPRMVEDAKKELKTKNSMQVRLCYDGMSVSLEKMGIEL